MASSLYLNFCNVLSQLNESRSQVAQYLHKYNTRLAPGNLLSLRQLIQVLKMISNFVQGGNPQVLLPSEFVIKAGIDNLNLFKIIQFLNKSQLCRKLNSFKVFVEPEEVGKVPKLGLKEFMNKESSTLTSDVDEKKIRGSPLLSVIPILSALCRPHNEGRIVLKKDNSREIYSLKYLLLNPAAEVKDVINESRLVFYLLLRSCLKGKRAPVTGGAYLYLQQDQAFYALLGISASSFTGLPFKEKSLKEV
jgi:chromosome transmission fidelity protein 1